MRMAHGIKAMVATSLFQERFCETLIDVWRVFLDMHAFDRLPASRSW